MNENLENKIDPVAIKNLLLEAVDATKGEEDWPKAYAQYMTSRMSQLAGHDIAESILENLLHETKQAHTEFEKVSGHPDEDWAGWYSEYISNHL